MKQLKLIAFFTCLLIMGLVVGANAQIKQDAAGNYYAVKVAKDSSNAKPTGRTFTNSRGETFPIYVTERGKFYILRIAKVSGRTYKQYFSI